MTRPLDEGQVSLANLAASSADTEFSEDSDIYKQLVDLYEYTSIIHFTALGKPWMYSAEEVAQHRQGAHPASAHQFGQWRKVAEQICPEGYLDSISKAALSNETRSRIEVD